MTRVASGAVLVVLMLSAVWFATPLIFLIVAELLVLLACREYAALSAAGGIAIPSAVVTAGAMLTTAAFAPVALQTLFWAPVDTVLMTSFVAVGSLSDADNAKLASVVTLSLPQKACSAHTNNHNFCVDVGHHDPAPIV